MNELVEEKDEAQCDKRGGGGGGRRRRRRRRRNFRLKDTAVLGSGFLNPFEIFCQAFRDMADFGILSPLNTTPYTLNPES